MDAVTINWYLIGAKLANLSDDEQGEFFKGFTDELLTWDTHCERERQMLYIRDKLTKKQRSYIETIGWEFTINRIKEGGSTT